MSETYARKTAQEARVVIRKAQGTDAAVIAELHRSLVPDPHINVRPARPEAIAADPNTYLLIREDEPPRVPRLRMHGLLA
jgi:sarcosine oxidase gamma subunit